VVLTCDLGYGYLDETGRPRERAHHHDLSADVAALLVEALP